jgi:hypothetical protein
MGGEKRSSTPRGGEQVLVAKDKNKIINNNNKIIIIFTVTEKKLFSIIYKVLLALNKHGTWYWCTGVLVRILIRMSKSGFGDEVLIKLIVGVVKQACHH